MDTDRKRVVGARIRALRVARGWTQKELGRRAGVTPNAIAMQERGMHMPTGDTIDKLAQALGVEPGELFKEPVPLGKAPEAGPAGAEAEAQQPQAEQPHLNGWLEEQREYPYPWMSQALARLLATWDAQVRGKRNPAQSRTIAVSALDVQDAVTLIAASARPVWDALPKQEKAERKALAEWLEDLVMRGLAHYKESKEAQKAELEAIERRREEIRRRTAEIA